MRVRIVLTGFVLLAGVGAVPGPARACVVGTGTSVSCTEATLDDCLGLSWDGAVTFDCGGAATITVTSEKIISRDTTIDGGGLITLSRGELLTDPVFVMDYPGVFTVQNVTVGNGSSSVGGAVSGSLIAPRVTYGRDPGLIHLRIPNPSILNSGTLTVTNSTFSSNGAGLGGAISNSGMLTVTNSTFSGYIVGGAILNSGTLTVANSTFFGNRTSAILNFGMLTAANSTFSGNSALNGGAIDNGGTMMVTNSTFSGNDANDGGAIYNGDTMIVTNSTFSVNSATGSGGAITNNSGIVMATNSTFSGNDAYDGGAIYNEGFGGHLTATNSTFSGNDASVGGAIANSGGIGATLTVTNSILANTTSGGNCSGPITDGGHNIDDGTTCGFTGANCVTTGGTSSCNTNPLLDPTGLADNGGPTETIALEPGSQAIDAGDETVCAAAPVDNRDQRGFVRPGMGAMNCSIGAYEFNAMPGTTSTSTTTTSTTTTSTTTTTTTTTSTTLLSCGSMPEMGCQPAAVRRATLLLGNGKLKWKWISSGVVATGDFGDPTSTTDYLLCLYDATGEKLRARMLADRVCGTQSCWKALGTPPLVGFKYADATGTPDGLTKALLRAGGQGAGKIRVIGVGANLSLPSLPLVFGPVRVQLRHSASNTCWEATYNTAIMNDRRFKAKSD